MQTYPGQVITVKSMESSSSVNVCETQVLGVDIDCPYTSFSNEDGMYDVKIVQPSGEFPKNMHVGVIASTVDVFDPKNVSLLEANSSNIPESMLISLNIDANRYKDITVSINASADLGIGITGCDETIRGYRQRDYVGCQTHTVHGLTCQR